jgi:hypothetical protein
MAQPRPIRARTRSDRRMRPGQGRRDGPEPYESRSVIISPSAALKRRTGPGFKKHQPHPGAGFTAGVGFEPTGALSGASGFQDRPIRPLWHPALLRHCRNSSGRTILPAGAPRPPIWRRLLPRMASLQRRVFRACAPDVAIASRSALRCLWGRQERTRLSPSDSQRPASTSGLETSASPRFEP